MNTYKRFASTAKAAFSVCLLLSLPAWPAKAQTITNTAFFTNTIPLTGDITNFFLADGVTPRPGACLVNDPNGLDESPLETDSTRDALRHPSGFNQRRLMTAYNPNVNGGTIYIGIDLPGGSGADSSSFMIHSLAGNPSPNFFDGVVGANGGGNGFGRGKILPFDADANGEPDAIGRKAGGASLFRCADVVLAADTLDIVKCLGGSMGLTDNPRLASGETLGARENYVATVIFDNGDSVTVELFETSATTAGIAQVAVSSTTIVPFGAMVSTATKGNGAVVGFDVEMAITNVNNAVPDACARLRQIIVVDSGSNRDGSSQGEDQNLIDCLYSPPRGLVVTKQCPATNAVPGSLLVFTGSVRNTGQVDVVNLIVLNDKPAPNTVVFGPATLLAGATNFFTNSYTVPANFAGCAITDTLTATGLACSVAVSHSNGATCPVTYQPRLAMTKICPVTPPVAGGTLTFSGTITNIGNSTITNIVIVNDKPVANTPVTNFASLAPGAGAVFSSSYTVPANHPTCTITDILTATGRDTCGTLVTTNATRTCPVNVAALGDFVWEDMNRNGQQDISEPGISNVMVRLYDCATNLLATTNTGVGGKYLFTGRAPGMYLVRFTAPAGHAFTLPNVGNDAADSDADASGFTTCFNLGCETNLTVDAGLFRPAAIGDFVWLDGNTNGLQDVGEPGVSNVTVKLMDCAGTVLRTTNTDANGLYLFADLVPGNYNVMFNLPAGYVFTAPNQSPDDRDSDATLPNGMTACYPLVSGQTNRTVDAGLYQRACLGDYVWEDVNRDGIQNDGATGLSNVVVQLIDCGTSSVLRTTNTGPTGLYLFCDLDPGLYRVRVLVPGGYQVTVPNATNDCLDSDADATGLTPCVTLASGQTDLCNDIGLYKPATLGDFVWLDGNTNGLQDAGEPGVAGVTVKLMDCAGTVLRTTNTDANGLYLFADLVPGNYNVMFNLPAGYVFTAPNQSPDDRDSDATLPNGMTTCYTLVSGQTNRTVDAGLYQRACLGDFVWEDVNRDGIQNDGATGISNVVVQLIDCGTSSVLRTTNTGPTGLYLFCDLDPGLYRVRVLVPGGYQVTIPNATNDCLDSDADATGLTPCVTLASGQTDLCNDIGLFRPAALGDFVWFDRNNNGIQEVNEPGVSNVTVLLMNCAGVVLATNKTDANGLYLFTGLVPGAYKVTFTNLPPGFLFTIPNAIGDDARDSDADPMTGMTGCYTLVSGETNRTADAGLFALAPQICVTKEIACFMPGNTCGPFAKTATGYKSASQNPAFCYRITINNCGPSDLTNVTVIDDKLGDVTTNYFPTRTTVFAVGQTEVRFFKMAWAVDTTNTVTASGVGTVIATTVTRMDSAVALIQPASVVCQSLVSSPDDLDGNPNDNHVQLPTNSATYQVSFTTIVCNPGAADLAGVTVTSPVLAALGCAAAPPFDLAAGRCFTNVCVLNVTCQQAPIVAVTLVAATVDTRTSGCAMDINGSNITVNSTCQARVDQACPCDLQVTKTVCVLRPGSPCLPGVCVDAADFDPAVGHGDDTHALWLPGIGTDFYFIPDPGQFVENPDGTATITGTVRRRSDGNKAFIVNINLSGRTAVPSHPDSPKKQLDDDAYIDKGGPIDPSTWYYYLNFTGTLTGIGSYAGGELVLTGVGPSFQVGFGASGKNLKYGASAWFTWRVTRQPNSRTLQSSGQGDINIDIFDCPPAGPPDAFCGDCATVQYTYVISNTGASPADNVIVMDDKLGAVPGSPIASIPAGQSVTLTAITTVCATVTNTVTVSSGNCPQVAAAAVVTKVCTNEICVAQAVWDAKFGHGDDSHALWLPGIGTDFDFMPDPGRFVENADGTATLTGIARRRSDDRKAFQVSLRMAGRTTVPPPGSPKKQLDDDAYIDKGGPIDPATWRYYPIFIGTLTGLDKYAGAELSLAGVGGAFQVGVGASGKNLNFGASAWFEWRVVRQPNSGSSLDSSGQGDINVDLFDCPPPPPPPAPAALGDVVWLDRNVNGLQDSGEPGVPGVSVQLLDCHGLVLGDTQTDFTGAYFFHGLMPAECQLKFVAPGGYSFTLLDRGDDTSDSDADPATGMVECMTMVPGVTNHYVSAGIYLTQPPGVVLTKTADRPTVAAGGSVVYTYTVSNPGAVAVTNLVISDDNGTPGYGADDFVAGALDRLAPGASASFTVTNTPPAPSGATVNSQPTVIGTLRAEILPNGDVQATYLHDRSVVDNTYGTNAAGYASGRAFDEFVSNDRAQFRFVNGAGQTVLDIDVDYLGASASFPSGYGSKGVSGGDGAVNSGSAANVVSATSTLSISLNQAAAYYGYTVHSPAPETNYPAWNYVNGYIVVVRASAFGASGFGGVTVPFVQHGPSKLGSSSVSPAPYSACLTSRAVVSARYDTFSVSASAQSSICVSTNRLGAIGYLVWNDSNGNGAQDGGEPGLANVPVQLRDCSGSVLRTTNSGGGGLAFFGGLGAGSYKVAVTPPAGFNFTPPNLGGDALDSDTDPATGLTECIALYGGETNRTAATGLTRPPAIHLTQTSQVIGGAIRYSGVVSNRGGLMLTNVIVASSLLLGLGDTTPSLAPGAAVGYQFDYTPPVCGTEFTSVVTATARDISGAGLSATASAAGSVPCPPTCIAVTKEVARLLPGNSCTPFGKSVQGIRNETQLPAFCYAITVSNCGPTPLGNVSVTDDRLAGISASFPATLAAGQSETRYFSMAWGEDTTGTVTATARGQIGGQNVSASDSATALVSRGLALVTTITAPCDEDGQPDNDHLTLPSGGAACAVRFSITVSNAGPFELANVILNYPALARLGSGGPVVVPSLPVGAAASREFVADLSCSDTPVVNDVSVTAQVVPNGVPSVYDATGTNVIDAVTLASRSVVECGSQSLPPALMLMTRANYSTVLPGAPVSYTYTVKNSGGATLTDVAVMEDNGTPDLPGDDFLVGTVPSLAPNTAVDLTSTYRLPLSFNGPNRAGEMTDAGLLIKQILPDGNIKATFVQSFGRNDNSYGANAIGWRRHRFNDLVYSGHAVFSFTDAGGRVVLKFMQDYCSPSSAFPSGYGCLGVTGGDGGMLAGSAGSVLQASSSLSENLNKQPFLGDLARCTVESPALNEPDSAQWEYRMIYTCVVDKNVFGSAGFGDVTLADQHHAPVKDGPSSFMPYPCSSWVTNTATVTARQSGAPARSQASAVVRAANRP